MQMIFYHGGRELLRYTIRGTFPGEQAETINLLAQENGIPAEQIACKVEAEPMSIHILFTGGSNPYVRYNLTPAEFARELLKWTVNYDLEFLKATDSILHFLATEKGDNSNG